MPISNFPNGFNQGVAIRGIPLQMTNPGKVFWVNSSSVLADGAVGGSNSNKGTYLSPFSTIDYAVGRCTANRGDIIMVMPGHVETVIAAAGLDLDVAGISIIGLGTGSKRPQINFTTATTADMDIDAANITLKNLLFTGGVDALVAPIDVNAADCVIEDCEYRDVTGQATDVILTDATCTRFALRNWRHDGATAAGGASAIAIVGGDGIVLDGLRIDGNFSVGCIDIRTTATTDLEVLNVIARNRNAVDIFLIDTITASTGIIGPNIYIRLETNAANVTEAITGATFVVFDNVYVVNAVNEKAMLINWTATTDAIV